MDPSFVAAHSYLGQIYVAKKRYEEAIHEFQTALSLAPGDVAGQADLAHAYAISGRKSGAEEILQEMESVQGRKYVSGYDFATAYAGFKDVNKTLEWLEKAYVEKNGRLVNLAVHPQFAFLRKEPRFQRIVEEIWGTKLIGEPHS
jgi:predicted Zn-dependent protease